MSIERAGACGPFVKMPRWILAENPKKNLANGRGKQGFTESSHFSKPFKLANHLNSLIPTADSRHKVL
jgi:hypothetical protein